MFKRTMRPIYFLALILLLSPRAGLHAQVRNLSGHDSTISISNTVFLPKLPYDSGQENWDLDLGDIDHDGDIDIVTCSQLDSKVNVQLNDGKGQFLTKTSFACGNFPRSITLADFNRDGWLDIAVVSIKDSRLSWLLNTGTGSFYAAKGVTTGPNPHDVTTGDVNQDGFLDLVTITVGNNSFNMHYGDGEGNFTGATTVLTGTTPRMAKVVDINKDNIPDVLTGSDDRSVNVHLGLGGGKFKPLQSLLATAANWGIGTGDFDKDGDLDIAACSYSDGKLAIIKNLGTTSGVLKFSPAVYLESGDYNFDLVIGDFDMDGDLDIVTASTRDMVINVHLNDGRGTFSEKNKISSGAWNAGIAAADLDGDKDMDIATASIKDNKINIHRNRSIEPEIEKTSGCVYGTVTDKNTGAPLKSVVAVMGPDGMSVGTMQTGADGKYRICNVPFGRGYTLTAKANGYPKYNENFDLPPTTPEEGLNKDVQLEKIKESFVFGKITDQETHEPLVGATVTIKDKTGTLIATLTADGRASYKQTLKFDDNYEISVSMEGYNGKSALVSLYPVHYPAGLEKNFELLKIKPKTTACVRGRVLDIKTKEVLSEATVTILDKQGNTVQKIVTKADGKYEACVPFGSYDITATRKGYMFRLDTFTVALAHAETGLEKDMELVKLEVGMNIVLKNIYYDVAKATLRPESVAELNRLIQIMNENPTLVVELAGHTDSDGSDSYNLNLSQARAQSVVDYLLEAGIGAERLVAKGYGETKPIVPNDTPANKQLNRRTEFTVLAF